jgi:nicotinate-nucleotide--dimethylbenzimidazole phosphoribosyltransferase
MTAMTLGARQQLEMRALSSTLDEIHPTHDAELAAKIQHRLDHLTKPRGSLGRLEEIVMRYGLARRQSDIEAPRKSLFVFCADHGIAAEGVSAYPQDVTHQMVLNFLAGGAAINVLCRHNEIDPVIVDMGVNHAFDRGQGIIDRKIRAGTRNFLHEPAMSLEEAVRSVEAGMALARAAARLHYTLLAVGEMGIANTTSSSAVAAAMTGRAPAELVGAGTGITAEQRGHKAEVIRRALDRHRPSSRDPLAVLAAVGGFEIGGMCGFLLGAAACRVPVVVDGFIASAGALLAVGLAPAVRDYLYLSHESGESGHQVITESIGLKPLLSLGMCLGEGTGSALAIGVIEAALRLYREMATFESAGVSEKAPD